LQATQIEQQARDYTASPAAAKRVRGEADGGERDRDLVDGEHGGLARPGGTRERSSAERATDEHRRGERGRRRASLDAAAVYPALGRHPDDHAAQHGGQHVRRAERLNRSSDIAGGDDRSAPAAGGTRAWVGQQQVDERSTVQEHERLECTPEKPRGACSREQGPRCSASRAHGGDRTCTDEDRPGSEISERGGFHRGQPSRLASAAPVNSPFGMKPTAGLSETRRR
jgi:hypothetical protein